jgi:RHS repeat-associated protein
VINPATEILEENNYYPFGLKHKGYNQIANSCRSEEAEAYKFNGKEYEDALGLNLYEMDMRQLDPAIGRWMVQDPVIHHDYSPYSAFDNNPVYWADPSGADSETDWLGRDRFGSDGLYIPPMDRGGGDVEFANFYSWDGSGNGGGDGKKDTRTKEQREADTRANMQMLANLNENILEGYLILSGVAELKAMLSSLKVLMKDGGKNVANLYAKVEIHLTKALSSTKNPTLSSNTISQGQAQLLLSYGKIHKHHIFPQQFSKWFSERGISNIDDYTVMISQTGHLKGIHGKGLGDKMPGNWNGIWRDYIKNNPEATPSQIFHQAESMLRRNGLEHLRYVPYKK